MTRKTFTLVSSLIGAAEAACVALVTYYEPSNATAINASIVIGCTAIIEICNQFVKD